MKLLNLKIQNLIGISEANLTFKKKIALFIGENGGGKTSLASAAEYLATGTARGLTLKKDRHRLIHRGAGKTEVVATLENDVTLRRSTATTTESFRAIVNNKETGEFPFSWNVIGLNPYLYFEKSIEERKSMLFRLVAGQSSTETLKAKLIERGVPEKTAGEVALGVQEDGFAPTLAGIIEERKALKRQREAFKEITAPREVLVIDEAEYVLNEYTLAELTAALKTVEDEKSRLLVEKGKISSAAPKAQVQEELETVITELTQAEAQEFKDPDPLKAQVKAAQQAIDKLNNEINAARATKKLMQENFNCQAPNLDFDKCPVMEGIKCPVPDKDRKKVKSIFDDRKKRAEQATHEADTTIKELTGQRDEKSSETQRQESEIRALELAIANGRRTVTALRTKKAELDKALLTAVDAVTDTAKLDEDISAMRHKGSVGETLIRAVESYHGQKQTFEKAGPAIAAKDEEIGICDLLDKALSPNGIPSELTQDAMGEFKARLAQTSKAFGVSVDVNQEDYLPLWDGNHYNLLCESEKWRVRFLFQDAIASLARTPWLIVDEASILDFHNREKFFDVIMAVAKNYDFVAIFATQNDETISVIDHEMIDFWRIDNGRVDLLKPVAAQAA